MHVLFMWVINTWLSSCVIASPPLSFHSYGSLPCLATSLGKVPSKWLWLRGNIYPNTLTSCMPANVSLFYFSSIEPLLILKSEKVAHRSISLLKFSQVWMMLIQYLPKTLGSTSQTLWTVLLTTHLTGFWWKTIIWFSLPLGEKGTKEEKTTVLHQLPQRNYFSPVQSTSNI